MRKGTGRPEVRPGEPIVFDLEVGNRGGVAAAGVTLIEELPAGLVYVDAEPAPRSLSPLAWEVGDLPVGGGPYRVVLATALEPGAAGLEPLANAARVQTASDEVEVLNNQAYAEVRVCHRLRMPLIVRPW